MCVCVGVARVFEQAVLFLSSRRLLLDWREVEQISKAMSVCFARASFVRTIPAPPVKQEIACFNIGKEGDRPVRSAALCCTHIDD